MNDERLRILHLLAEGKVTAEQADALIEALSPRLDALATPNLSPSLTNSGPKFLRVLVEGQDEDKPSKVNVRIPIELLRAGMRLAALLPVVAHGPVNRALKENGVDLDISKIKSEDLEALVGHLNELQVDVDDGSEKVRVFCE